MNLTELMRQHMSETQDTEQICQLINDIVYVDSKHNKVFDYVVDNHLSTQMNTIYGGISYHIMVTASPTEKQVYPSKPRYITINISTVSLDMNVPQQPMFTANIGYDQHKSFVVDIKHNYIDKDVLTHCLNALFD